MGIIALNAKNKKIKKSLETALAHLAYAYKLSKNEESGISNEITQLMKKAFDVYKKHKPNTDQFSIVSDQLLSINKISDLIGILDPKNISAPLFSLVESANRVNRIADNRLKKPSKNKQNL